jgi:hypothetical protein
VLLGGHVRDTVAGLSCFDEYCSTRILDHFFDFVFAPRSNPA